jgi:hypothetical protein
LDWQAVEETIYIHGNTGSFLIYLKERSFSTTSATDNDWRSRGENDYNKNGKAS